MSNVIFSKEVINKINIVSSFLACRDIENLTREELQKKYGIEKVDLIILLGNSIPYIAEVAGKAFVNGIAEELMIVGGIGHSTEYLRDNVRAGREYCSIDTENRSEADIFKEMLVKSMSIDENRIIIENQSTNCGANAKEAFRVINELKKTPSTVILIQDPTMQLRTNASFIKEWEGIKDVTFINYAPFIPKVELKEEGFSYDSSLHSIFGLWSFDRFLSLVMGEIPRLKDDENGYGPKGKNFIGHIDIPEEVMKAYGYLLPYFNEYREMRNV